MTDDIEVFHGDEFLVIVQRASEQQLIILTAVQRTSHDIQIHLLSQGCRLEIYRQLILVDAASYARLRADMHQFRRQSVRYVHHRRRLHAGFLQGLQDISSGLRFELAFQQVLAALEGARNTLIIRNILITQGYSLTLQQLQSHICRSQVSAYANQVIQFGAVAIDDILCCCRSQTGDGDTQARHGCTRISAYQIHAVAFTRQANTAIQLLDIFDRETLANPQAYRDLRRCAVHRVYIREIDYRRLISQVFQRYVFQIKMDSFQQHVRGHQDLLTTEIHHRAIITDTFLRGRLHGFQVLGEMLNQTELTIL